jgi:ATP-dependent helicase/nuclease subunit A
MEIDKRMEPTRAQIAAIQTEGRPVMVDAGAGSGKTWVLVQRFIYLLDRHPDWPVESLIAVTFTEKAAREMRTRIRQEVEAKARQLPDNPLWQTRRRELDRLQVGTIHSLCAQILRENAIAAQIDPRFDVLDEQEAELMRAEAVRSLLSDLSALEEDSDVPALGLLAHLQVSDLHDQLSALLAKRGTVDRLFENLESPVAILAGWEKALERAREDIWQSLVEPDPLLSAAISSLSRTEIVDLDDRLAQSVELAQQGCLAYSSGRLDEALSCWLDTKLIGGRAANWGGKQGLDDLKSDLKLIRGAAKVVEKAGCARPPGLLDEQAAQALHWWGDLWVRLEEVYAGLKNGRALDFDDLEILTERLLKRRPYGPRLQTYIDSIRQVMVDEFQDTNERQRNIVYALADPRAGGPLFVVGDAKQSIYRFRQAQVAVFNRTARDITSAAGEEPVRLDVSFRSHQALLAVLNELFEAILKPLNTGYSDYEARPGKLQAVRDVPAAPERAAVELQIIQPDDNGDNPGIEEIRLFEAQLLAKRLIELHRSGFQVWDKEQSAIRPFEFSDAAILFRATTSLPLYEEQFKAAGLPYLTVSGRGYYDRPEVRDLISILRCLENPADDLSLATALRSPLFSLSDETIYQLRWLDNETPQELEGPVPFYQALKMLPETGQNEAVRFAAATLGDLWELSGRVDVWRLLRAVLDRTGYDLTLALTDHMLEGNGRQYSNVQKLLELAREKGGASLSGFLRSLDDLRAREAREGEALGLSPSSGQVQLMSIHAAKGLEFPVVVVADLGRIKRHSGSRPRILFDPAFGLACELRDAEGNWQRPASYNWAAGLNDKMEEAERKRLLYVACTRAADLLILSGAPGKQDNWLKELLAGLDISESGAEDERLNRFGYPIHVNRPTYAPEQARRSLPQSGAVPNLVEFEPAPRRVLPLPVVKHALPQAVTQLMLEVDDLEEESTGILPAVLRPSGDLPERRASSFRIGRLVHRALAHWECLSLPDPELQASLRIYAHREGILHPDALRHAVDRSRFMLRALCLSPLYKTVNSAPECYREIPFSIALPAGLFHGVIDLLYQDRRGTWHLVDWKTEWIPRGGLDVQAQKHRFQMAVYAEAVHQAMAVEPVVSLCFLSSYAAIYTFKPEDLAEAIQL